MCYPVNGDIDKWQYFRSVNGRLWMNASTGCENIGLCDLILENIEWLKQLIGTWDHRRSRKKSMAPI